jgi:hypothetical protein
MVVLVVVEQRIWVHCFVVMDGEAMFVVVGLDVYILVEG